MHPAGNDGRATLRGFSKDYLGSYTEISENTEITEVPFHSNKPSVPSECSVASVTIQGAPPA